jgi:type IV secretion system protein VirD4
MEFLTRYALLARVLFVTVPFWFIILIGLSLLIEYLLEGGPLYWLLVGVGTVAAILTLTGLKRLFAATPSAFGAACFATLKELKAAGLFARGPIIGRFAGRFLRVDKPGHLLTFAPTRSGKGVGAVIPNLLDHRGSMFVTDIKGENLAITGEHRKSFGRVIAFAPFEEGMQSDCYNPLDFIRVGTPLEVDDARMIAEMIVSPDGQEENHWEREARVLITGLLLHVLHDRQPYERTLYRVRCLLMRSKESFTTVLASMSGSGHPAIKRIAEGFSQKEDKERSGVISTAQSRMEAFESPLIQAVTCRSTFQMEDLKRDTVSLYVVIPPEYTSVYKPVLRLLVGLATAAMTRDRHAPRRPVLFLLDELPALGHMRPIEDGIGYLAGYGASLWLFVQDLDQLQKTYRKWNSMIANCAVRQAFNVQDVATAQVLSDMLGQRTVRIKSGVRSGRMPWLWMSSTYGETVGETGQPLLSPAQIMALKEDQMLVFVQGCKPILAEKIRYFAEKAFAGLYSPPPMVRPLDDGEHDDIQ